MLDSNPQMREQMRQMIELAEQGKLPDRVVDQMINPFGQIDDELSSLSPGAILNWGHFIMPPAGGLATYWLAGSGHGRTGQPEPAGQCRQGLERIPGVGSFVPETTKPTWWYPRRTAAVERCTTGWMPP
ncbi:MAG: hypothetical protein R2857_10235 [Vampirovibrionales bacterium]